MRRGIILALAVLGFSATACAQQNEPAIDPRTREQIRKTARESAREIKRLSTEFQEFYNELRTVVQEEGIADLGGPAGDDPAFGRADIVEEDREMIVKVDMPGVRKSDVAIRLKDRSLLEIEAKREAKAPEDGAVRSERHKGGFRRELKLPATAAEGGFKADLADGVLTVRIPKEKESTKSVQNIPVS